ncbi:MAG: hypothetical protein ACYTBJ_08545 [Planctomycetota bacterium]|jgi:hypothetical protein
MKNCLWILILAAAALALSGCKPKNTDRQPHADTDSKDSPTPENSEISSADAAPLLLDDEPLLLDAEPDGNSPEEPLADNSRCHVCHINYTQEDIALTHARAGIGCNKCHGQSDEHIADESWASGGNGTPPEIMYTRDRINQACMSCHPRDKIDTEQHEPLFAANGDKVCTDCHGNHRLHERRCKWK